ncbi:hypothetical protein [Candidatus Synechococcus spongiarum]|nr:hypothetical protein [Candidatus Synechococcus spongiarum]
MLLIVVLAMGLVTLAKALNEKPPLISLTETDSEAFKFDTGSYGLSQGFLNALDERYTNDIKPTIEAFDVDVIEVIGHTDGQPNPRVASNLDRRLQTVTLQGGLTGLQYSSNAELGLLRAIAVGMYLQSRLEKDQLPVGIRPYSAASLLDLQGNFNPAPAVSDDRTRRRIDLRFTRSN